MSSSSFSYPPSIFNLTFVFLVLLMGSSFAQLSTDFYSKTCPELFDTVKPVVESAVSKEKRMGASLLRLHFHDCFVNGCDGSILLDDNPPSFIGEKTAPPNNNSVRGFNVIDDIKLKVEDVCPGVVSCADIVAIAARDSVVILGGPNWDVKLGRRDSKTANTNAVLKGLISPNSSLSTIISKYKAVGLSITDMVALSGGHTIGQARCFSFRYRIYNDPNIDTSFAKARQESCPSTISSGDDNLVPLDLETPTSFDNSYFKNLISQKGLLHSDQELYNGGSTDSLVEKYCEDPSTFNSDFAAAMVKMGDISPLTGSEGEIRKNCRKVN